MQPTRLTFIISAALAGALALSACGAAVAPGYSQPAQPHTITVTGSGVAYGAPDLVLVQLGVQSRGADPAAAVEENNQKMARLLEALTALGVDAKDVQTSNFSVTSQQEYDPQTGQARETFTFVVDNTVSVTLRDTAKLGQVLGQTVAAGANNIYGVTYTLADANALTTQARDLAMTDAKARAEQLAKAAGISLGQPVSISEYTAGPQPYAFDALSAKAAGGSVPVSAGQYQVTLQVTVSYAIP